MIHAGKTVRAVIVDDMQVHIDNLRNTLAEYCPNILVVGEYTRPEQAIRAIPDQSFEILFLDIEMPVYNGFELIRRVPYEKFKVIFVSSHPEEALTALNLCAIYFIVKPVTPSDLIDAISKVERYGMLTKQDINIIGDAQKGIIPDILVVHEKGMKIFLDVYSILYIEAKDNYCSIVTVTGEKYTELLQIGVLNHGLSEKGFQRTHRSFLVNLRHVKTFNVSDAEVILLNEYKVKVSRTYLDEFKSRLPNGI